MRVLVLCLISAMVFSIGCAGTPVTRGTPIESAKIEQLVPGTTNEGKVVEMFGNPAAKQPMDGGKVKYIYTYYQDVPKIWRKNIQQKSVLEVYLQDGIVQGYDLKRDGIGIARQ